MEMLNVFCDPIKNTIVIGILAVIILLWYSSQKHSYWKKKGVPFVKPFPLLGSFLEDFLYGQHELDVKKYRELGPVFGFYEGINAAIAIADPELLKYITVKDFPYFSNRRTFRASDNVVNSMMITLSGEDWKRVRTLVTPTFTTGKLKRMIGIFNECSATLIKNFKAASRSGKDVNIKEYFGAMSMDVIASSAFSTKIDSHNDPENKFVQMSKKVFSTNFTWRLLVFCMVPKLSKLLGISVFDSESIDFFKEVTVQIINERKRLKQTRNDFLQLLLDTADEMDKQEKWEENKKDANLTNNYGGELTDEKVFTNSVTKCLSIDELVGQCVLFFIAGFESTSYTLSVIVYCLATNPFVQEKARQEVKECLAETKGEITYDAIQKMSYLDNVISETLRMYPAGIRLERVAEVDYKLGDTGITIEKNTVVVIPVYALHRDPTYYPNPEVFDPNRFSEEEKKKRNPYVYMPFGSGPRHCIGMRFALLEIKVCLIHLLKNFSFKTCSKTQIPLKYHFGINMLRPHDIHLTMEPRDH